MAEITTSNTGSRNNRRRSIAPIKIDMTPMVDLGFLLITFFMLTTHLLDQRVMNLTMPVPGPPTKANNTLTILLAEKNTVYGYQGAFDPGKTELQPLGGKAMRNTLRAFKALNDQANTAPVCIVKAGDGVRYVNVVDAVDELNYAGLERFCVQDSLYEGERTLLAAVPK